MIADPETVSSIRVSWYPVPEELRGGTISQYKVWVKKRSGDVVRNVTVTADNRTVVIGSLDMYVTYSFQVQAFTSQGGGPFSFPPVNQTTKQTGMAAQLRRNNPSQTEVNTLYSTYYKYDDELLV